MTFTSYAWKSCQSTVLIGTFLFIVSSAFCPNAFAADSVPAWQPHEIRLTASRQHPWWEFPVRVTFARRSGQDTSITVEAFWDGDNTWVVRAALPQAGTWTWRSESDDAGLNGRSGVIEVVAPTAEQIDANPNLRGQIRIAKSRRYFEYADGTPFFLLADTLWAGNTSRCGLGEKNDGPFFRHLADRKEKGFTAILMQYFHGYGDYPESPGHRNEGGKPYLDIETKQLNPAHFQSLDVRMQALWEHGFVAAIPATWWGKTNSCVFTPEDARRMSAYCAVRYGAFNALWSLSGEYQYAFKDCGWTPDDFTAIGDEVQRHNPFHHPLSIHPSGQITWKPPHNVQSSKPFHGEAWLDHHWLQTGQTTDRLFNIVTRLEENRVLEPAMPVFCSESYYERADDADTAYHTRWQIWTAYLNGAAGYGYGSQGVWQFLDPSDPRGETGKRTKESVPWPEAVRLPGSEQVRHARTLLSSVDWWKLQPMRADLQVDGKANALPNASDITPPQAASICGKTWIVYLPRGNAERKITVEPLVGTERFARWFNPRSGELVGTDTQVVRNGELPRQPNPADEDWVLFVE